MGNTFTWPIIHLIQRLSVLLTLGCCAYVVFFLLSKNHDNAMSDNSSVAPAKAMGLSSPVPTFELKPFDASASDLDRDIFSLTATVSTPNNVDNTPKGQLPDHLKVVGILIDHPSQIVIEDTSANRTYFIDEGNPQNGIKIVRANRDQMIINYQGQDIPVPVSKY